MGSEHGLLRETKTISMTTSNGEHSVGEEI